MMFENGVITHATRSTTLPTCETGSLISVTLQTGNWGHEVSWRINDECMGDGYENGNTYETVCCLTDSTYVLRCMDSFGDGWQEDRLIIGDGEQNVTFCETFDADYFEE